ncbi:hypothetical protein [Erythrobacter tepidarius]|uniref:hypothetical protein n=1 Tax=Erythrobacter tepidarius TaxID=60454 RepID=UPI00117DAB79|nr:hypothetical protein [Erythrobacter tepidarius]
MPGKRPTRAAILDFVARQQSVCLSHDPAGAVGGEGAVAARARGVQGAGSAGAKNEVWLELLRDGLTFDLRGLAPGPCPVIPPITHRFDFTWQEGAEGLEALAVLPGPHLAGGERSMPVMKAMLALARDLTQHFPDLIGIHWAPSHSVIGGRFFESVITAWLDGGVFPALGITAFEETPDGALQSLGLDVWIGQEVRIEPPLAADRISATRLAVRLINQLVIVGGLDGSERIIAPDGTRLVMQASRNSQYIRVRRE